MRLLFKNALVCLLATTLLTAVGSVGARGQDENAAGVADKASERSQFSITSTEIQIIAKAHKALLMHDRRWRGKDYEVDFYEMKDRYSVIFLPRRLTEEEKKKVQAESEIEIVFDAIPRMHMGTEIQLEKKTLKTLYSGRVLQ